MSLSPADIAAIAARIRAERGEAYARDMLAELRGILAEEDGIAPVDPYPLQYGWSNKGAAGGKKFRWYNDETKENRYQISEPGTRKAKQGEQPPKPQRPAKPDAATLQTELQGLNRADITPEHVEAVTRQLVGLTKEQMHGMREGLGIPEKGWKTLPKGRLAAKLVEHVRGGGKPAQKPGKAGQQPFDPDVVAQSIVAARGGSGDVEGALAALSSLTLPQLRAVRERMGAEAGVEKGGRSREGVAGKIIAAVRQGGKAEVVPGGEQQPQPLSPPLVAAAPETPAEQTPDATPALHPEAQKHMDTFQKSLDGATHLSPEQKTYYAESVHKVLGRMTPAMLQRFGANFHGKVHFAADLDSLREHLADSVKHNPTLAEKVRKAKSPGGAYLKSGGKASFALDGDRATTSETSEYGNKEASGIYAHEFAHAIDGMSKEMSKSEGWQKAFQSEISGKKLTRYADTDPSEAFAEFGRLLLSGEHDHTAIKQVFPQAFAVWKDAGLVDDPQAEPDAPTGAPAPVKMAEMFGGKVDLGEQGHVDEKLNVASPTPQSGDSGGASPGTPSPDVPSPSHSTPHTPQDIIDRIHAIDPGIRPGGSILARDLMRSVPPEQRQAISDAIIDAAEKGLVTLQRHDHPALLHPEERAEMPRGPDGTYYTGISFRSDKDVPKPSGKKPAMERQEEEAPAAPPSTSFPDVPAAPAAPTSPTRVLDRAALRQTAASFNPSSVTDLDSAAAWRVGSLLDTLAAGRGAEIDPITITQTISGLRSAPPGSKTAELAGNVVRTALEGLSEKNKKVLLDRFRGDTDLPGAVRDWMESQSGGISPPDVPQQPAAPTHAEPWTIPQSKMLKASEYDQRLRGNYYSPSGEKIASSREKPAEVDDIPLGTWKVDDTFQGYRGRDIEQLQELDPQSLALSETLVEGNEEGRGWDADRYAEWIKAGHQPPPINVVQMENGKYKVTDGHRRLAAAKKAGVPIRAWVSPVVDTDDLDSEGKPIKAGLTHEMAIERAARDGKAVPEDVLADHPTHHEGKFLRKSSPPAPVKPSASSPVSSTGATAQPPAEDTMQSITHAYANAATLQPAEFSAALSTVDGLGKPDLVQAAGTLGMKGVKGWSADRLRREIRERLKRQRNGEGAGKKMAGGTSGKRSTPAAPAAPAPSSPDVARAFLAHPRAGNLVSLADLQQATGLDTTTLHAQINALRKAGILTASGVEGRDSLTDPTGHKRLMDAGIREGSDVLGYVSVREGAEEKLKEMAGKKSERSAAETSAAWDAAKKAYEQVYQKAKFTTGVVKIPELIDAMRKIAPDLSPVDIREMLQQWQKEDKLTLGLANDPRLEPRAAEGVHTNRGLRMYVQMHPEA